MDESVQKMIPFNNIKVLLSGYHDKVDGKTKLSSTITLIKAEKNIIIDAGGFGKWKEIIQALAKEKLKPEEIDIVFLTHLHLDHVINVHLFPKAKIYCKFNYGAYPGQFHSPEEGTVQRAELKEGTELVKDVSVLELPGHTGDHLGLLVHTDKGKVVICGDAIASEHLADLAHKPDSVTLWNSEEYDKTRKKILGMADLIIPGHGEMFKGKK